MKTLFDQADREALLARISTLQPEAGRLWGTMTSAQMIAHLAIAMSDACGARSFKQSLLGKIVTPLIRSSVFGEKPFGRNSPTHPTYIVSDTVSFESERARLVELIGRFAELGPGAASGRVHPFFGSLTAEQWGVLTRKHIDHHLRQFGA
jgi:hypothetical protein